jgi:hypothetical protein
VVQGYVEAGGFLLGAARTRISRPTEPNASEQEQVIAEPLNNEAQVRGFSNTHRTARVTELDGAHRTSSKPCASQSRRTAQTSTSSECWTHAHTDQARPRRRIPANDRPTDRKRLFPDGHAHKPLRLVDSTRLAPARFSPHTPHPRLTEHSTHSSALSG